MTKPTAAEKQTPEQIAAIQARADAPLTHPAYKHPLGESLAFINASLTKDRAALLSHTAALEKELEQVKADHAELVRAAEKMVTRPSRSGVYETRKALKKLQGSNE